MRMSEITVNENFILKALGMGKGAAPAAAKVGADDAAIRAAQDARLSKFGKTGGGLADVGKIKVGDMVNVDLRAYKNQTHTAPGTGRQLPHVNLDSDIAKVVEIVPLPNSIDKFVAKVETIPGKARQEPIMHNGRNLGWKDVPAETKQYTIPVEFLSIRK